MEIKRLQQDFTVCKVSDYSQVNMESEFCWIQKTDQENSLVCLTEAVPTNTIAREDGWTAFRVEGELDFGLVGILAKIAAVLAAEQIPIFAISTYNTDYILVKKDREAHAIEALRQGGYHVL